MLFVCLSRNNNRGWCRRGEKTRIDVALGNLQGHRNCPRWISGLGQGLPLENGLPSCTSTIRDHSRRNHSSAYPRFAHVIVCENFFSFCYLNILTFNTIFLFLERWKFYFHFSFINFCVFIYFTIRLFIELGK